MKYAWSDKACQPQFRASPFDSATTSDPPGPRGGKGGGLVAKLPIGASLSARGLT
jgi:hypothetical protein